MIDFPLSQALAAFMLSLLGGLHCAGMCGGFVCVYAGSGPAATPSGPSAHVAYHGGRLISYLALGAAAGAIGGAFSNAALLVGIRQGAMLLAGAKRLKTT